MNLVHRNTDQLFTSIFDDFFGSNIFDSRKPESSPHNKLIKYVIDRPGHEHMWCKRRSPRKVFLSRIN